MDNKYMVRDMEDGEILEDNAKDEKGAMEAAEEFFDSVSLDDDTEEYAVGIYKLVKTIRITRKVTKTVTSVK